MATCIEPPQGEKSCSCQIVIAILGHTAIPMTQGIHSNTQSCWNLIIPMCSWKRLEPRKINQPKALFSVTSKNSHGLPFLWVKVPMHDLQGQSWPSPGHHRGTLNEGNATWCQVTLLESSPKKGNEPPIHGNTQRFQLSTFIGRTPILTSLHHTRFPIQHPYPRQKIPRRVCSWKGWNKQLDGCWHLLRWDELIQP